MFAQVSDCWSTTPIRCLKSGPGLCGSWPSTLTAPAVTLEDLDGRRLPGAVGAEEAEHLALLDLEIDAANRLEISVRLAQAANGDCAQTSSSSTTTCPQGGNAGSGPPARAATARPQSG